MLRQRIEYALYLPFKAFVQRLSLASARRLGRVLGGFAYYVFRRRTRQALENLELVFPEMAPSDRRRLARRAARNSGAALVEGLSWSFREATDGDFELHGEQHVTELMAARRPFIAVGAHFGVGEVGLVPIQNRLERITVVAKPATNPYFRGESARFRERRRFREVPSQGATRELHRALRQGESIGLLVDQRVNPEDGVLAPFLGVPGWTSTTVAILAVRCGAPILPFFVRPVGRDAYRVDYLEPLEPPSCEGGHQDAILELTRRVAAVQEECIRAEPEYWFWVHDRWRRIKRYAWDETKARWRLRSRLPERSAGRRPELPPVLLGWLREMERGAPLQLGLHYRLGLTEDGDLSIVTEWAHALIDRGRSVRWLDDSKLDSDSEDWRPRDLDLFDLVVVVLGGTPSEPHRRRLEELASHRSNMRRSVMWVGPAEVDAAIDGAPPGQSWTF